MKLIQCLILCCLCSLYGKAQDTLFFKNAGTLVVTVKEVSPTEIQYKKFDMPDGPMYIVSRNDLEKIVYKNGYTESLKPAPAAPTATIAEQSYTPAYDPLLINHEKIDYADTKRRYSSLVDLIYRHPDPKRRDQLAGAAANLRSLKIHQDGTRTGAIIFGGIAIAGAVVYTAVYSLSYHAEGTEIFAVPPVLFGTLGVILGSASVAINLNLKKKRHEFVRLYND
jgi:hypothetical protein